MITREELERMYWQDGKSIQKIANETKLSMTQILYRMIKFGIPRRSKSKAAIIGEVKPPLHRIEIDIKSSKDLAYVLGVLKGDGYVYLNEEKSFGHIKLGQIRAEFAKSFELALQRLGFTARTIIVNSKYIRQGFFYLTYGYSIKFARWYKQLSLDDIKLLIGENLEFIKVFIRGFYESEGYNSIHPCYRVGMRWTIGLGNTDEKLSLYALDLLEKLKFNFRFMVTSRLPKKPYFTIHNSKKHENLRFIKEIQPCIKNQIIKNPPPPQEKWSKERVISELQEFVTKNGFSPHCFEVRYPLRNAAVIYFGKWNAAKLAAGIKIYPQNYNRLSLNGVL